MNDRIDVSVAIACFNAAEYLEKAVRSALAQTAVSVEVLIVDDGSTDDSRHLAARLAHQDPRIALLTTPQNLGPAGARNIALDAMKGTWYAVLDADDHLHPDRCRTLMDLADAERYDLVSDNLVVFGEGISEKEMFDIAPTGGCRELSLREYLERSRLFGKTPNPGYLKPMIRRTAIEKAGLRYNPEMKIGEDDELIIRALSAGLTYLVSDFPGYYYRKHTSSVSHRLSLENLDRMIAAEREIASILPPEVARSTAYRSRWQALVRGRAFTKSVEALKSRDPISALLALLQKPSALRLYAMPLEARFRRLFDRFGWLSAG